jgi:hypothetical protein
VRRELRAAGRDPDTFEITLFGVRPEADLLARARDAGVARCVFGLPSANRDEVMPVLDRHAELLSQIS